MYRRARFHLDPYHCSVGCLDHRVGFVQSVYSTESPAPGAPLDEVRSLSPQVAYAPGRSGALRANGGAVVVCRVS